jgi:hypothetical protein
MWEEEANHTMGAGSEVGEYEETVDSHLQVEKLMLGRWLENSSPTIEPTRVRYGVSDCQNQEKEEKSSRYECLESHYTRAA